MKHDDSSKNISNTFLSILSLIIIIALIAFYKINNVEKIEKIEEIAAPKSTVDTESIIERKKQALIELKKVVAKSPPVTASEKTKAIQELRKVMEKQKK